MVGGVLVGVPTTFLHGWMIWQMLRSKPLTEEEKERADMRSLSMPCDEGGGFAG
jgi:hypothetical protein